MFSFTNVANGRKSLLDLFPDVRTIVDLEHLKLTFEPCKLPPDHS